MDSSGTARAPRVTLLTEGDPGTVSGGYLYHRRIAELAGAHRAELRFLSVPQRAYPMAVVDGPGLLRRAADGADVVVVDSLASNTLGPWLALGLGRVPVVGSVHQVIGGSDTGSVRRTVQRWFDRLAFGGRNVRTLVVPSELLAEQLRAAGLPAERMCVIPPGRDVYPNESPPPDLRAGRASAVLCAANWLPRKGILSVLEGVAALPAGLVTLHLVGDETSDPAYRRRVLDRLGRADLAGRVVRHGIVAPEEMGPLYEAADVFVLASTEEPYGIVYGEAMAAGLPVVGWAAGNLPNLVDDGVEGRVVTTGDVRALSAAIGELCADEAQCAELGEAAALRAHKLPTWAEAAEQFYAVCRAAAISIR